MKRNMRLFLGFSLITVSTLLLAGCSSATDVTSKAVNTVSSEEMVNDTSEETTLEAEESGVNKEDISAYEFYKEQQHNGMAEYSLNMSATTFLKEHPDLFPTGKTWSVADELIDYVSKYEHISKSPDTYGDKLVYIEGAYVGQIKEEAYDGGRFTWFNAMDDNENMYSVFYRGQLPDIIKGSVVNIFALPIGSSSYDNVGGGKTLTIVLAGCNVTLYGSSINYVPQTNVTPQTNTVTVGQQQNTQINYIDESEFVLPYSDSMYYSISDIGEMHPDDARIAINEIYARHGRMFTSKDLQDYFNSMTWYHPSIPADQFDESILNDFEKKNIELLKQFR